MKGSIDPFLHVGIIRAEQIVHKRSEHFVEYAADAVVFERFEFGNLFVDERFVGRDRSHDFFRKPLGRFGIAFEVRGNFFSLRFYVFSLHDGGVDRIERFF